MSNISTRVANTEDLKVLLEFEQEIIEIEKSLDPFLKIGKIQYYFIEEMIAAENTHLMVAVENEKIVGSGYVRIEKGKKYHKNKCHGYIGFIYVKPAYRGKKISNLLLDSLKSWAKQRAA